MKLRRVAMGPLLLDESLALGEYRELTVDELAALRAHRGSKQIPAKGGQLNEL